MPTVAPFQTLRHEFAGLSLSQLAEQFGTPTYLYDVAKLKERIADLSAFDCIRYAQKACSNLAILDRARRAGVKVDAVSAGEIQRALAAGFTPEDIIYTADIFDAEALRLVAQHGLAVNCGSPDMISQLGAVRPGAEITLRINPGFGHGHSQKTNTGGPQSKHGIWHTQLDECLRVADQDGISITGLHMHIGSGTDLEHLAQVCDAMAQAAISVGRTVRTISAGGGLPVPYRDGETFVDLDQYFKLWDATRKELVEQFGHPVELEIEPGRYLVAEAGCLLAQIRAVKKMGDNLFFLVDAGFNDLARPVMYGAYHPIAIVPREGRSASDQGRDEVDAVVGGPLCESGDIFTQKEGGYVDSRRLPMARVGDYLVLENAGAYGFVMASNYNSKLRPAEVLVEEGEAKLIRRRETFEDLVRNEMIPPLD